MKRNPYNHQDEPKVIALAATAKDTFSVTAFAIGMATILLLCSIWQVG